MRRRSLTNQARRYLDWHFLKIIHVGPIALAAVLPGDRVRVDRDGDKDAMRFERVQPKKPAVAATK